MHSDDISNSRFYLNISILNSARPMLEVVVGGSQQDERLNFALTCNFLSELLRHYPQISTLPCGVCTNVPFVPFVA